MKHTLYSRWPAVVRTRSKEDVATHAAVYIDRDLLAALIQKAALNKSRKSHIGPLFVEVELSPRGAAPAQKGGAA